MKTITISLDGELEQKVDVLSRAGGADTASLILHVLKRGLAQIENDDSAARALEEVLAAPVPPPFAAMSEESVMALVEAEIAAARTGHIPDPQGE